MLVSNKDAEGRLSSPGNLLNMLRNGLTPKKPKAMDLFVPSSPAVVPDTPANLPAPFVNPFKTDTNITPITPAIVPEIVEPEVLPTTDDLLSNADAQIKLAQAHDKALTVLVKTVETLHTKLDDIKPEKLAGVMTAAAKVVEGIRKEKIEQTKSNANRNVHFHFYEPKRKEVTEYETMDV